MQKCRNAEMQKCRNVEMRRCRIWLNLPILAANLIITIAIWGSSADAGIRITSRTSSIIPFSVSDMSGTFETPEKHLRAPSFPDDDTLGDSPPLSTGCSSGSIESSAVSGTPSASRKRDAPDTDVESDDTEGEVKPLEQLKNVMVVTGGMMKKRVRRPDVCQVLKLRRIIDGGAGGAKLMWRVHCTSQEACKVLTGRPECDRPLVWKGDVFFRDFREAVAKTRETAYDAYVSEVAKVGGKPGSKAKFRPALLSLTMTTPGEGAGQHTMTVENSTKFCSVEATIANIEFMVVCLNVKA